MAEAKRGLTSGEVHGLIDDHMTQVARELGRATGMLVSALFVAPPGMVQTKGDAARRNIELVAATIEGEISSAFAEEFCAAVRFSATSGGGN